ncbi:MAG: dTDP-glucose 4,6-dehydratase [Candidatus Eisenbacteria sp.]|nr:dTDP-glucose 4,6-dehydratase [Candidatus Eisenbacteria bacterium]
MANLLITGGAGFIGSNFTHHMARNHPDWDLVVIDKLTYAGTLDNLRELEGSPRFRFVHGDICERSVVEPLIRECDLVINFAAETHVDRSIEEAGSFVMTDMYGVYVLLECARAHGLHRFVHVSTDEVYGEAHDEPCREDSTLEPKSPYAASKTGGDRLAFSYWVTYGMPVFITRCTNNYGPRQYPEKMVPLFITNALVGEGLPVYGSGRNTRDWIFVEDHCRALETILLADSLDERVYNIGTGDEFSILEMARSILETLGLAEDRIQMVEDRPGHVLRHAVSTERIRKSLGWAPEVGIDEGMRQTVDWYRDNEEWWRKIRSGEFEEYYRKHYREKRGMGKS